MQDYVNLSTSVSTANNVNGLRAVGHGTLPILVTDVTGNEVRVDLKHVLHAPLCTHNLLSVARFTDMKMHVEFVGDTCTLHTPAGDQFEAERPQNLFELTARAVLSSEQAIALRVDDDVLSAAMALHQSLGHRHWKKVKEVLKAGGVPHLRPEVVAELLKLPTFTCKSCARQDYVALTTEGCCTEELPAICACVDGPLWTLSSSVWWPHTLGCVCGAV